MNNIEHGHLPRLNAAAYRGFSVVHWTMAIRDRKTGWLSALSHAQLREAIMHTAVKYYLLCPVYCLMPDHVHLMWMGMSVESDQLWAAKFFRKTATDVITPCEWQREAYDHVLREEERNRGAFAAVCHYVLQNPVKAGLVNDWSGYSFSGACLPGYPDVEPRRPDYWDVFWKLYVKRREMDDVRLNSEPKESAP
ncbi:MAG: hypothetical protein QM760_17055 [Nibricoccus sp.]